MNAIATRITRQTLALLEVLLEDPSQSFYGLELLAQTKMQSGTLYPMLARLERAGWIQSRWEDIDPSAASRPRRRYYTLTAVGREKSAALLLERGTTGSRHKANFEQGAPPADTSPSLAY